MQKNKPKIAFDLNYYKASNLDISDEVDAAEHYRSFGWREGRDPSPLFDSHFYTNRYSDFDASTVDPLEHYNEIGRSENRLARPLNVISLAECPDAAFSVKAAFHCRIEDLSIWPEICDLLADADPSYPIFLSVSARADFYAALRYAEKYKALSGRFSCVIVPRGLSDLDVLLVRLRDKLESFDVWANLSTQSDVDPVIRVHQLGQTFGSRVQMAKYMGCLANNAPAGLCFSETFRVFKGQTRNAFIESWPHIHDDKEYPSSSTFWARTDVLIDAADRLQSMDNGHLKRKERHADQLKAIWEAADIKHLGFLAIRSGILRATLLGRPAVSARENSDQRGERWRALSPSITENRPLPLVTPFGPINSRRIDLHWVIPDYSEGGGGHMTIFRFVNLLDKAQFRQTIWIQNCFNHATPALAKQQIQSWYQPISDDVIVRFLPDDVEAITGDAVIATDCWTAFPVSRMARFKERFYFIQDWESEFHPAGDLRLAASLTHHLGFTALTAGTWLAQKAASVGMEVVSWKLGADTTNYHPKDPCQISDVIFRPLGNISKPDHYRAWKVGKSDRNNENEKNEQFEYRKNGAPFSPKGFETEIPQIALYARGFTPRRAVDLAIAGLRSLAARGWLFHVHLYGEDKDFGEMPFIYTPHGLSEPKELGSIYAKCDVGIAFSATNYSLVPLEMMVSDIPVVEIDTESTRAAYPEDAVVRARPAAYAIADELEALLGDPERRRALIAAGRRFVEVSDWEASVKLVGDAIVERMAAKGCVDVAETIDQLRERSTQPVLSAPNKFDKPAASIFIPTYNAGRDFDVVLQAIAEQQFDAPFELVIIDSGSSDETLDFVKRWSDRIRINSMAIDNTEFGHGRTRNRGIDASEGEYVAIITQDACPASPRWLQNLVNGFGAGDRVAGVFGRHVAYPIHDLFEGAGLRDFFEHFRLMGDLYSIDDDLPGYVHRGSPNWQSTLQFYSDNNSCMRKSVWKAVPYRDVPWGEDQVWAWDIMRLGFQKAYAHDAAVYHSHDYVSKKLVEVGTEEGRMFLQHFGMYIGIDGNRSDSVETILNMVRGSMAGDANALKSKGVEDEHLLLRRAVQHLALFLGRSQGVTETKRRMQK